MFYPDLPGPCSPLPGDILFQHTSDEPALAAVSRLFSGVHDFIINHVAVCACEGEVIEACPPVVRRVALNRFIANSHPDENGAPRVLVCRVEGASTSVIHKVIQRVSGHIGYPYNETYLPDQSRWYCSSLIQDAWHHANDGVHVFPETPLEFRDRTTGQVMTFWNEYYRERGMDVPLGLPGSHPALISRSLRLNIVGCYGRFQQKSIK